MKRVLLASALPMVGLSAGAREGRVIEIPTPRWTAYDAARLRTEVSREAPMVVQDRADTSPIYRAYTSPIWYTPA